MKTFKFSYEQLLITVELGLCQFEHIPMSVRAESRTGLMMKSVYFSTPLGMTDSARHDFVAMRLIAQLLLYVSSSGVENWFK